MTPRGETGNDFGVRPTAEGSATGGPVRFVYVAGPINKGDQFRNVAIALEAADELLRAGFRPFVPHLFCFWQMIHETDYETWLNYDFDWLTRCDALLRIPGESPGADREMVEAERLGLVVWSDSVDSFIDCFHMSRPFGPEATPSAALAAEPPKPKAEDPTQ